MYALQKSIKKASARRQIDIKGVRKGVLILPRNHYRIIFETSSLNFSLKSDAEQDAITDTYQSFLNSLGFPLQILIRTREIDLDNYLDRLNSKLATEKDEIYRTQLKNYNEYISTLVDTNTILTRNFYVVVSYDAERSEDFDQILDQLNMAGEVVCSGLARMGIQTTKLSDLEMLDLFYSFYSPEQSKVQPISQQALELLHTTYMTGQVNE